MACDSRNGSRRWRWVLVVCVLLAALLATIGCDQPDEFTPAPATIIRAVDTPTAMPTGGQGADAEATAVPEAPGKPAATEPAAVSEYPSPAPVEYVTPVPGVYPEGVTPGVAEPLVSPTPVEYPVE